MSDKVLIIGGGASGMMAAIMLAREGRQVTLVEKNKELGRKVLITGNGRCNLTNANLDISRYHGENPLWAYHALTSFDNYAVLGFFEDLGVPCREESDGRYFTVCGQASAVVAVMADEIRRLGVELRLDEPVVRVEREGSGFATVLKFEERLLSDRLVIAAGGESYPKLGSSGDGYRFAESFGHRIVPTTPSLVPLQVAERWIKAMEGLRWDVLLQLIRGEEVLSESYGEVLFRSFGISGPPTLAISREAARSPEGTETLIRINFFPDMSEQDLDSLLETRWQHRPERGLAFSLIGLLPDRIGPAVLTQAGFDPELNVARIGKRDRQRIVRALRDTRVTLDGPRSYAESQVTAGGVATDEVNPKTMESRLVPGLYFTGEVLDIDGDSGGFNLQFAFSTAAMLSNEA